MHFKGALKSKVNHLKGLKSKVKVKFQQIKVLTTVTDQSTAHVTLTPLVRLNIGSYSVHSISSSFSKPEGRATISDYVNVSWIQAESLVKSGIRNQNLLLCL